MFHIEDMEEWDETDARIWANLERQYQADLRSGPCEDSQEMTAPYIGMLPDENGREEPSPLDFRNKEIDFQIQEVLRLGTQRYFVSR